ncbi:MAG TPA: CDP-alcohol phosphatidyltransferase family protein [Nitriliruptorales bacterium]|nr:CDP-alcohol phosphatidyltransferase family protein [Nitriliruptorales bacterium]
MTLDSRGRSVVARIVDPIGAVLARLGITANGLTTMGLLLTAVAAALVASGRLTAGGWVLLAGGLGDTLDGPVARARGEVSVAGGFYDSVADRISDGMIVAAVAWAVRDDPLTFAAAATVLIAAQVTSYVRAKAESLGTSCAVGVFERAERAIALTVALVFHRWLLVPVLWVLALGTAATVVQRIVHVLRKLDRRPVGAAE